MREMRTRASSCACQFHFRMHFFLEVHGAALADVVEMRVARPAQGARHGAEKAAGMQGMQGMQRALHCAVQPPSIG